MLEAGYDITIFVGDYLTFSGGHAFGTTEQPWEGRGEITYDPRHSQRYWADGKTYNRSGIVTLAHEINHAFANAFPSRFSAFKVQRQHEQHSVMVQNQWNKIKGYPLENSASLGGRSLLFGGYDRYVKQNPHF